MGNQLDNKFVKSNFNQIRNHNDEFIIKYNQNNKSNELTDITSFDPRRKVFISLLGLYRTWRNCPSNILYSSIFILPLKSKWIYSPLKYIDEIRSISILSSAVFKDIKQMQEFIQMLQWKDSQGCCIWMLNDYANEQMSDSELIQPIWYHISNTLVKLKLNKLNLDTDSWKDQLKKNSEYDVTYLEILSEFYFTYMKFKTLKEIIHQSNPEYLHPIKSYISSEYENNKPVYKLCKLNDIKDDDDTDNWWISADYDAEDI
eukprot:377253_1